MQEHMNQEQRNARMKELRVLIVEHEREIAKLEHEYAIHEHQRLLSAPGGTYLHRRGDGSEVKVEAYVLETQGEAKYIQYKIPRLQARRGEEDAYLRWLRSPEELARFTPR